MDHSLLILHSNDAEWPIKIEEFLLNQHGEVTEEFLSQLFFRVMASKWPLIVRNAKLKEILIKSADLQNIHPCSMASIIIEKIPLISAVNIFNDNFKELIFQIVNSLVLTKSRIETIINHCNCEDSILHPPIKIIIKGLFRLQEILTNYLAYCPKTLIDPVYLDKIYSAFVNLPTLNSELTSNILQNSILYNKMTYLFSSLIQNWNTPLKDKFLIPLSTIKSFSEVNFDVVILKIFDYFHENKTCSKEIALELLEIFSPAKIDLSTIRRLSESKYFDIREASLFLYYLYKTTPPSNTQIIFSICSEAWGNRSLTLIAPLSQHRCNLFYI